MTTEPNNHLGPWGWGGGIAFTGLHGDHVSMAMRPKVTVCLSVLQHGPRVSLGCRSNEWPKVTPCASFFFFFFFF